MTSRWLASTLSLLVLAHAATATALYRRRGIESRGFIKDEQGAVLPGVSLTATTPQSSTQFSAVSDSQGFYRLVNLPPGTYEDAIAALQGFSKQKVPERKGLEVRAGDEHSGRRHAGSSARFEETIQVTPARMPMLEVVKTTEAINISGEFRHPRSAAGASGRTRSPHARHHEPQH